MRREIRMNMIRQYETSAKEKKKRRREVKERKNIHFNICVTIYLFHLSNIPSKRF